MNFNDFLLNTFSEDTDTQVNAMRNLVERILDTQVTRAQAAGSLRARARTDLHLRASLMNNIRKEGEMDMQEQFEKNMGRIGDISETEMEASRLRVGLAWWPQEERASCYGMSSPEWEAYCPQPRCPLCGSAHCAGPHDCD